jgi:molybdenum cofactor guanylyltransferase
MEKGVIILCGGKSTRMGHDKATLPFGPEMMLQRIVRIAGHVVPPERIVVVAATTQELPPLPSTVAIARDKWPERGPLQGLAAGFEATSPKVEAIYVTGCDVPLLVPDFIERMFDLLDSYEIAVPRDQYYHPLAAVYRHSVSSRVQKLLEINALRLTGLLEMAHTREISVSELRDVDAGLMSLANLNTPEDYQRALMLAGFLGEGSAV